MKAKVNAITGSEDMSDNCNHNILYWPHHKVALVPGSTFVYVVEPSNLETLSKVRQHRLCTAFPWWQSYPLHWTYCAVESGLSACAKTLRDKTHLLSYRAWSMSSSTLFSLTMADSGIVAMLVNTCITKRLMCYVIYRLT